MESLAEIIRENPSAAAFGALGLLCQMIWPLFHGRRSIMAAQFGVGASYSLQYALLGAWSGAGVAGLGAVQSGLAFAAGDRPWLRRSGIVFLPIVTAFCLLTWNGLPSLLALAAVSLIMLGRLQVDTLRLRILQLSAVPFGIGHDILVGAAPALIGGTLSAAVAAAALLREIRLRRNALALAAAG